MALLFELLLTAALTLLAAFVLSLFFAANDPRREPDRAAAAIAEEEAEEGRIIEVDEVKLRERSAAASAPEAEGWVEVEKAPVVVMKDEEPECSPKLDEVGATVKVARVVSPGAGLVEEVGVGEKRCDLDDEAETARSEALGARPDKRQDFQIAEVLPTKLEAIQTEQKHLVSEDSPAAEVLDAGMEESLQAIEVKPDVSAAQTTSDEIPDVVLEKKEEQIVEAKDNELTSEVVLQATLDVPSTEEEREAQQPVEEAVNTHEEVRISEEAKCKSETPPVDQQGEMVPEEGLVATKTSDVVVSHEGSSSDRVVTELHKEVVTLQGVPEDGAEADMYSWEWEGIERSEVEKRFGAAAAFAASETGSAALSKLSSDVQLQLEGLLKVAIDGPCYDSMPPLTLRPSSRAKWVAWQKLGNMHPEIAMEKYMNLLSEVIPGWLGNETSDTKKHETGDLSVGIGLTMAATSDQHSHQGDKETTGIDKGHLTASLNPEKGQSSNIPAE